MSSGNRKRDFSEARRRLRAPKPIGPINDQFSHAGGMYQGAVGWLNLREFLRQLRQVRRERRARRPHSN